MSFSILHTATLLVYYLSTCSPFSILLPGVFYSITFVSLSQRMCLLFTNEKMFKFLFVSYVPPQVDLNIQTLRHLSSDKLKRSLFSHSTASMPYIQQALPLCLHSIYLLKPFLNANFSAIFP